jgi:hypothetical protein
MPPAPKDDELAKERGSASERTACGRAAKPSDDESFVKRGGVLDQNQARVASSSRTPLIGGLIDDQPIQSHVLYCLPKLIDIDGLLYIAVGPQVVSAYDVPFFPRGGRNNNWDVLRPRVALELFENFQPIDLGQLQIQHYHFRGTIKGSVRIDSATEQKVQGFLAVAYHEDVCRVPLCSSLASRPSFISFRFRLFLHREGEIEGCALVHFRVRPYSASVLVTMRHTVTKPMPVPSNSSELCNL